MNITQYVAMHPQYRINFERPVKEQPRRYSAGALADLPIELDAEFEYRGGGRGRPSLNQTLTHSQCATCKRVLRNDSFYCPPSLIRRNVVYPHCLSCTKEHNAERYDAKADNLQVRRAAIWDYIAPCCAHCGFNKHSSAMDMHHARKKDELVSTLVTDLAAKPTSYKAEKLLYEAKQRVPLCSNCHRMLHAGIIQTPHSVKVPAYDLITLLDIVGS